MRHHPTVDEFIQQAREINFYNRDYVIEDNFESLYVRYCDKYINGTIIRGVLDIANVTVEDGHRGKGVFTRLLKRLRDTYPELPIHIENALNPRFQNHLRKLGLIELNYFCFFLPPNVNIKETKA